MSSNKADGAAVFNVAVFASGQGTNFQAIVDAVKDGELDVNIKLLFCDKPGAPVIDRAGKAGVPALVLRPKDFASREVYEEAIVQRLQAERIDLIVLAGYMRLVTKTLLEPYAGRIVNIHPALLPAFPGTNGIGDAFAYGVKIAGVTVHFVDEGTDTGPIIAQRAVPVYDADTEHTLAERIHEVERELYPKVIGWIREGRVRVNGRKVAVEFESARRQIGFF